MDVIKSIIVWIIGICFMVILFPATFIVWLIVLPFDTERSVIHWMLMYQSRILVRLIPVWKINTEAKEKAVKGTTYVIISNHQSVLDILFINSLCYRFKWISKIENINVPFLGWYLRMADYITVDRGDELSKTIMLEKSYMCLKRGTSIMIFPEGTRSSGTETGFFKRGAFQLALQANVAILPIVIDGTGSILPKHGFIFGSRHQVKLRILDPVMPSSFSSDNPDELAADFRLLLTSELQKLRSNR
jgi:1-acyl-sn-glycerol-3-phosphate acyltransferase